MTGNSYSHHCVLRRRSFSGLLLYLLAHIFHPEFAALAAELSRHFPHWTRNLRGPRSCSRQCLRHPSRPCIDCQEYPQYRWHQSTLQYMKQAVDAPCDSRSTRGSCFSIRLSHSGQETGTSHYHNWLFKKVICVPLYLSKALSYGVCPMIQSGGKNPCPPTFPLAIPKESRTKKTNSLSSDHHITYNLNNNR